ncbi:UDP-2,4-diacetamido-2,4,6-trideoxy-beta-L-altropyranose hydrolase [Halomonas sp. ATCH28]|uniref:UDP-2,4-diacetamido-2,4, 6-trideoxy-beta-L-altropyranose hydrolase n=1 Tax=Halomonas gemina TaxID=2945105 RepID=A0ABT0SXR5_9GAMM|nr:UDP-2,4-diacetamido-2,4,6-trideoxy-beta-L-altropyranose hydrolase [Halomonas gemina]MCL7939450.1 UDP-2,4-diacetamido-2,4,6-trideoxy-beta-L-altropyranose hydrolase [Halomonas gemina]
MAKEVANSQGQGSRAPRVVFRADASLQIGSGHVMRCLTLAEALREQGAECHFLCREHTGHALDLLQARGFAIHRLPTGHPETPAAAESPSTPQQLAHADWLGTTWEADAAQCAEILEGLAPDWLVVDHYALDARWEARVTPADGRLLVIDDLADREHRADLLLDQNLGRQAEDYAGLVPGHCRCLVGPRYALLRPEFAPLRETSLARRRSPRLRELLITLGGVDKDNATTDVLSALSDCPLPDDCHITVVMGASAPWRESVQAKAATLPWPTEVVVNVADMAERMAEADLAIGAAGSTSWERCCLGLPTLMVVLAENQQPIAEALDAAGVAVSLGPPVQLGSLAARWPALIRPQALARMSEAAASLTAGDGTAIVCHAMWEIAEESPCE